MINEIPANFYWDSNLKLNSESSRIYRLLWPNYICEESDILDQKIEVELDADEFERRCPNWGIKNRITNELVAYISAVQLHVNLSNEFLPEEGWSFAANSLVQKQQSNCLCLLVANTKPEYARLGFSQLLIDKVKYEAIKMGFNTLIAPVRPTLKHQFPYLPMQDYIEMKNDQNEIFDPWLRQHLRSGAKIVNICSNSVIVKASVSKWKQWIDLDLHSSGDYIIPKGLVPLKIDLDNNIGIYTEPNVWMKYNLN